MPICTLLVSQHWQQSDESVGLTVGRGAVGLVIPSLDHFEKEKAYARACFGTESHGDVMIREQSGDLLSADVEALVNAVNIVGVIGKGIALQFRQADRGLPVPTGRRNRAEPR